jgi:hypothetical protein
MALVHTSSTVGTSVVTVVPVAIGGEYNFIAIANNGSGTVYLKMVPSTVTLTASNGVPLASGSSLLLDQDVTPILVAGVSAVCDTGATTTIAVQAY